MGGFDRGNSDRPQKEGAARMARIRRKTRASFRSVSLSPPLLTFGFVDSTVGGWVESVEEETVAGE